MKVASIQFQPWFKEKARNLAVLGGLIEQAALNGAQLVVLPELATTGYSFMGATEAAPFAESWGMETTGRDTLDCSLYAFNQLAVQYNIAIVFGFVELDPGTGNLYNSQAFLSPQVKVRYQKVNFFGNDWLWATHGISNPPVVTYAPKGGAPRKVGLLICRDVRNKVTAKWSSFYGPGDADVVALSTAWGDGGFPATAWMDFCQETRTTLIVANRYGQEGPNNFGEGGICIISPDQRVECRGLVFDQDCIVYGDA